MTMAKGAYSPHAKLESIVSGLFAEKNTDIPTARELNPYDFEDKEKPGKTYDEKSAHFRAMVEAVDSAFSGQMTIHPDQLKK